MHRTNSRPLEIPEQEEIILLELYQLIEERNFEQGLQIIADWPNPSAEIIASKGLIYFLTERYDLAVCEYRKCLQIDANNEEWRAMLKRAESNHHTSLHLPVPEVYFFADDQKEEPAPALTIVKTSKPATDTNVIYKAIGQSIGQLGSALITVINWFLEKVSDYRDTIWTNWYRKPVFLGILKLGSMRRLLNKNNLISTYPKNHLIGFAKIDEITIPDGVARYRTANGSWNNLRNPLEGAARTRFLRNTTHENREEQNQNLLVPNPRELSLTFLTRRDKMKEVPFLNMISVAWIQFQNHDWISYGEPLSTEVYEVPLSKEDPARKRYWQKKLLVGKTQDDPWRIKNEPFESTYINECTHWWDGSQIYGSDQKTQDWLRSGQKGKLIIQDSGLLPRDRQGIEKTGFVRNWWVGLSMMHTLFVQEHNSICDHLAHSYPNWDDHQLFQTARLINAALMAKIHSLEWNAAINPNKALYKGIQSNWYGLLSDLFSSSSHKRTISAIKIRNAELGGILGNNTEKHGSPFGLTQEFVEVYRMHSLIPDHLQIRQIGKETVDLLPMNITRQSGAGKCIDQYGMENLLYSFGNQNPGQLILNNYPRFMQELSIPGNPVYDLGAVDILRARERGVPRYNSFRRGVGLHPIRRFEDLTSDLEQVQLLKDAYNNDVELIDLMIGALAEERRPDNFAFGETIFQIFLLNATRRLQADRFFTSCYTAEYYTQEGLDWIDENNLKSVLLRHYPALKKTGLMNIKNAFEPWDEDEYLCPDRHPLRAFDKSIDNAWKGDLSK